MILGIDPGTTESGWVLLRDTKVVDAAVTDNAETLTLIAKHSHRNNYLVIEKIASFGMPVGADVFETVFWSGRMAQTYYAAGGAHDVIRIPRIDVKMNLCHDSRAKDANIRQALIDRLGPPGTVKQPGPTHGVKSHAWAALAVAVTARDQLEGRRA